MPPQPIRPPASPRKSADLNAATSKLIDEEGRRRELVLAQAFNTRHVLRSTKARGLLCQLDEPEKLDWQPLESGFNRGVREVFRNRYWLDEELKPHVAIAARRRRRAMATGRLYLERRASFTATRRITTRRMRSMRTVFNTD